MKLVIAPHEVSEKRVIEIIENASSYFKPNEIARYSSKNDWSLARILILDNIGLLSSVYKYGSVAWIGGGYGKGIHNILEAVAFGLPVMFGPNYKKFIEAEELVLLGNAFVAENKIKALKILSYLLGDVENINNKAKISTSYIISKIGATDKILAKLPDINQ